MANMSNAQHRRRVLFGRDAELQTLCEAFRRSIDLQEVMEEEEDGDDGMELPQQQQQQQSQEFVLIQGHSGSGKTSLAYALQHEVHQHSGFFLTGKFELTACSHKPYAIFASMFHQFVDELFQKENKNSYYCLVSIREAIQEAVGSEGGLLIDILPSLERLIGKQPTPCDVQGANSIRRFQYLFCKLCRAVSSISPLVLFIDDLQWSDTASLQLLRALLQSQQQQQQQQHGQSSHSALLVIATCRYDTVQDRENHALAFVDGLHPTAPTGFKSNSSSHINVTKILLDNLDQQSMQQLVAGFMQASPPESCRKLAEEVYSKCQGSPYHAVQILRDLAASRCVQDVSQDDNEQSARPQLSKSHVAMTSMDKLVRYNLQALPELTQKVLQVSACMGDEIDESAVGIVLELEPTEIHQATVAAAESGHLTFDEQRGLYRFSHDQVRQAAMSQIEDIESRLFQIGYKLWKRSSPLFLGTKMFVAANLLNHGTRLLTDRADRYRAATLNWEAGVKAASLANFTDSSRYLTTGIEFLKGGDYWNEEYDLTLKLFNASADTEVCTQNYDRVMELVQEVFDNANTRHDKIQSHVAKINCLCQKGCIEQAISTGIDVLQELGETLPRVPTKRAIILEVMMTKWSLLRCSHEDIMSLQPMEDMDKLHAMQLLSILVPYAFQARSCYNPLMASRMVRLCLKHGFHKSGALGLVTYAWVMCTFDRREGYRMGSLAMSTIERLRATEMIPRLHTSFYGFTHHWRRPLRESLEPLKSAANAAMDLGDFECAMWALYLRCVHSLACGVPLAQLEEEIKEAIRQMTFYKQENMRKFMALTHQYIHNLTGRAEVPSQLTGEILQASDEYDTSNGVFASFARMSLEANLAYRFGDYARAGELAAKRRRLNYNHVATFSTCSVRQLEALISVACARLGIEKRKNWKIARQALKKVTSWSADCPENFLCVKNLLEAEMRSLKPQKGVDLLTRTLYNKAIAEAAKEGFTQQAALACELAGDFLHRQGDLITAKQYWRQAHINYMTWGATEKAADLSKKGRI